jgi:hypothetical protein
MFFSNKALSTKCAFSAFTELGPPESMIPTGFLAKISSKGVLNGRTSE